MSGIKVVIGNCLHKVHIILLDFRNWDKKIPITVDDASCHLSCYTSMHACIWHHWHHWSRDQSTPGSDCNPGIEFSIMGSGIKKFVIPGSRFGIKLTNIGRYFGILNWLTLGHMHTMLYRPLWNVYPNCREWRWLSKYKLRCTAWSSTQAHIKNFYSSQGQNSYCYHLTCKKYNFSQFL